MPPAETARRTGPSSESQGAELAESGWAGLCECRWARPEPSESRELGPEDGWSSVRLSPVVRVVAVGPRESALEAVVEDLPCPILSIHHCPPDPSTLLPLPAGWRSYGRAALFLFGITSTGRDCFRQYVLANCYPPRTEHWRCLWARGIRWTGCVLQDRTEFQEADVSHPQTACAPGVGQR